MGPTDWLDLPLAGISFKLSANTRLGRRRLAIFSRPSFRTICVRLRVLFLVISACRSQLFHSRAETRCLVVCFSLGDYTFPQH